MPAAPLRASPAFVGNELLAAVGSGIGAVAEGASTGRGSGIGGALLAEIGGVMGRGGVGISCCCGMKVVGRAGESAVVDASAGEPSVFTPSEAAANSNAVVVSDGVEAVAACPGKA